MQSGDDPDDSLCITDGYRHRMEERQPVPDERYQGTFLRALHAEYEGVRILSCNKTLFKYDGHTAYVQHHVHSFHMKENHGEEECRILQEHNN